MVSPVNDGEDKHRSHSVLERIAVTLGLSERAFSDGLPTETKFADTIELLRIWQNLEHAEDRRKLLGFARSLLAKRVQASQPEGTVYNGS